MELTVKRMKQLKNLMIRARANAFDSLAATLGALQALQVRTDTCENTSAFSPRCSVVEVIVSSYNRMEKVDAALLRMSDGTYGICVECGAEIGEGRLLIQPWAEHCIICQEHREVAMLGQLTQEFKAIAGKPMEAAWRV